MWITKTNFIAFIAPNDITKKWHKQTLIQGDSRVIMSPTELKMQPTIHLKCKVGYGRCEHLALPSQCIVGCIFNSVGLNITREIPCII
jgi:hypothetical protein